jgi:hypothetical protein
VDPTSELYLKTEARSGGPTDPITGFDEGFMQIYGSTKDPKGREIAEHPLFISISKFSHDITPGEDLN